MMPRKSMSLNPPSGHGHGVNGQRNQRVAGPMEPLNLMPELRSGISGWDGMVCLEDHPS